MPLLMVWLQIFLFVAQAYVCYVAPNFITAMALVIVAVTLSLTLLIYYEIIF